MESILVLVGLFILIAVILPWVNAVRCSSLRNDLEKLEAQIRNIENILDDGYEVKSARKEALIPSSEIVQAEPEIVQVSEEDHLEREAYTCKIEEDPFRGRGGYTPVTPVPRVERTDWVEKAQSTFEQNIATKLPVWIGSVSLIFAAFFLVKYSIEFGLLGPMARVSLGGLFGVALLVAGQLISKKPHIANSVRISQGVIGAGLVALYVSIYAAIHLYGLMSPVLGFCCMSVVTALAVVMSLRHGQPIAVFGVLGGLLTPALVGSDEPNVIALFVYLFVLFSGLLVVLIRKGWWVLAISSLLGVFGWSTLWFATAAFVASDSFVLVLFSMALAGVVLAATGKRVVENVFDENESKSVHLLNIVAIGGGVLTIILLNLKITLGLFDWSMLGLLNLALMVLAYFKPDVYQKPLLVKLCASLFMFLFWAQEVPLGAALIVVMGMCMINIGGGAFMMRQVKDPRFWAAFQVITALSLYVISYYVLDLPAWFTQSFGLFWGALALVMAGLAIYQTADIRAKYEADDVIQQHLVAMYALAASAFISLGFAIELPWAYLPLAFAGQIAATAWVYYRTGISSLKYIMYVLTLVFAAMNYEQAALFASVILHSLVGETPSVRAFGSFVLDAPLVKLGIPALLLYVSLWAVMRMDKTDQKLIHALFGTANILVLFTAYYIFRDFFHEGSGHAFFSETGFFERGMITMTLAGAGIGIIEFIRKHDVEFLKPWGVSIFRMAMFRFVYFDLCLNNPYWSDNQFVGNVPVLNGVTFTYGLGFLAVIWAIRNNGLIAKTDTMRKLYGGIALASIFALTSLNVRQWFHGGILEQGEMGSVELYTYSVVWLMTGLALVAAGIKLNNKMVRMASLAFITLAIGKVFLFDAAELEGLYRVFSFLGLGVSLIGMSYFYTKFVFEKAKTAEG